MYSDSLRDGWFGVQNPVNCRGVLFSTAVKTGPKAHPQSCKWAHVVFFGSKAPGLRLIRAIPLLSLCVSVTFYRAAVTFGESYIQGVPGGICQNSGGCSHVKVYRYNPKHLCSKLNGYGDNGQRILKI
jgi:hypothetical protein